MKLIQIKEEHFSKERMINCFASIKLDFCIGILNSDKISYKAKSEFIEKFVIPYMYDEKMKWEIFHRQITFTSDLFLVLYLTKKSTN